MAISGTTTSTAKDTAREDREDQARRNSNPGVRLVGNRIYCPLNGKTCHQCRQKTLDFSAYCKNLNGNKECTIKFCHKCLKNRYGEEAVDVAKLDDWKCPKCRGICNCSFCMKKRGHKPTGILVHAAKSHGFNSVSEMLSLAKPDSPDNDDVSKTPSFSDKDRGVLSPRKLGKENCSKQNNALKGESSPLNADKIPSKKRKWEGSSGVGNTKNEKPNVSHQAGNKNDCLTKKRKKLKAAKPTKLAGLQNLSDKCEGHKGINDLEPSPVQRDEEIPAEDMVVTDPEKAKNRFTQLQNILEMPTVVPLPQGTTLTTVCDVELPLEVVADSLQFLEFCSAFGKVLGLRKGEAEAVVRGLVSGRRTRNGRESSVDRIHIQLLSIIMEDSGKESLTVKKICGGHSWLRALGEYISQSTCALKVFSRDDFDGELYDYVKLDLPGKLKLLNFLCDEALGTESFRSWIEEENLKFLENGKKAKDKLVTAKDKEKKLKQKMLNKVAEAVIAKKGVPLSISEHAAIVAQVKHEIAEARAEIADTEGLVSKKGQRSDAVRTEPILVDTSGRAFWKLNAYKGEPDVLLQDLRNCGSDGHEEKWLTFDDGEIEAVDKYITSRMRRSRIRKINSHTTNSESGCVQ